MLVGHNTLRLMVMGMEDRAPTRGRARAMIALLEQGLRAGALGMSSGLFTPPGSYAAPDEMAAFGHVLKQHNAAYFTHLRDESNKVLEAVQEAIDIADDCGVHVEIVHFKCSGTDNWGKAATALEMIAAARARGARHRLRRLPLCRRLQSAEEPAAAMGADRRRAGDARAAASSRRRAHASAPTSSATASTTGAASRPGTACRSRSRRTCRSSPAAPSLALAAERGQDPVDTLCDYLVDDQGATRVLVTSISEDDIENIVASPMALVGSDGNCVAPYGQVGKGMPHPRFYGTFPRIIHHYVRERGALPLELAIHKMTGATARALKLSDRGLLKEGYRADVAIFDPEDFRDRATYADPHQFPSGARTTVIVNGVMVVENAKHTDALPGKVLRRDPAGAVS